MSTMRQNPAQSSLAFKAAAIDDPRDQMSFDGDVPWQADEDFKQHGVVSPKIMELRAVLSTAKIDQ